MVEEPKKGRKGMQLVPTATIKAPRFDGLHAASRISSYAKQRNGRRDTAQEVALRRELWRRGLRYRKNVEWMPGKPDIVFTGSRVVVFCDGDFWHGRDWECLRHKLEKGNNADYWIAKISSNMNRDTRINQALVQAGWHVIRLWESEIAGNLITSAELVCQVVKSRTKCDVVHSTHL